MKITSSVRLACAALLCGLAAAAPSQASSVRAVGIDEMLAGSELVVQGRVIGQRVDGPGGKGGIFTTLTLEVVDVVKGRPAARTIELRYLGGQLGDESLHVTDMEMPALGEQGVYFIEKPGRTQVHPLYGWQQGHLLIERDAASGVEFVKTKSRRAIYAVEARPERRAQALGGDVAAGLRLQGEAPDEPPLDVDTFKQQLRRMLDGGRR